MINLTKQFVRRLLSYAGYVILKRTNYEKLVLISSQPQGPQPDRSVRGAVESLGKRVGANESDFGRFLQRAAKLSNFGTKRFLALYSAAY